MLAIALQPKCADRELSSEELDACLFYQQQADRQMLPASHPPHLDAQLRTNSRQAGRQTGKPALPSHQGGDE